MGKFNTSATRTAAFSPVRGESVPSGRTHEGGAGYTRDAKSELFLLAVANMVGEDSVYEDSGARDDRYTRLVRQVAVDDPAWTFRMLRWLRGEANLRSAALVGAAEAVHAQLAAGIHGHGRRMVAGVLARADEPGEMLAYWTSRHGRAIPKPVKRGVADAVSRLYAERSLLKHDTDSHGYRFGDVIDLVHPAPRGAIQGDLFEHALDRRHDRDKPIPAELVMLRERAGLMSLSVPDRRALIARPDAARILADAGMTWEALAGWLQGPMDAAAWQAVIPSMGYMALLRNLRNLDQAGVCGDVAAQVAARLADPQEVARSRQLPMRFVSAYRAAPSLRWAYPLEQALGHSLSNVPELGGRTLILVDTSGSMHSPFSADGTLMRWDAAALFAIALARRCKAAEVVSFSSAQRWIGDPRGARTKAFPVAAGESLLRSLARWQDGGYFLGGGTETALALRESYQRHDRVVIVTDEQAAHDGQDVHTSIPGAVPLYTWNLAGYRHGHAPAGGPTRHTFGGLGDQAFRMIPLLEAGRDADWPF